MVTLMIAGSAGAAPLPEGDEKVRAVRSMFDAIAPRYDLVNRVMTFRLDVGWRRAAVRALPPPPGGTALHAPRGTRGPPPSPRGAPGSPSPAAPAPSAAPSWPAGTGRSAWICPPACLPMPAPPP